MHPGRIRVSQSPEGSLADFHEEAAYLTKHAIELVAIPRRVPRRFPPYKNWLGLWDTGMSQSPEGSLADFHSTPLKSLRLSGLGGHFR